MGAAGGLRRQVPADATASQPPKRVRPRLHCFQAMARGRRLVAVVGAKDELNRHYLRVSRPNKFGPKRHGNK